MIRVGASRRTRFGSVWVSMPLGVLALVVLIALPLIVDWYFLKLCWLVGGWLARDIARWRRGRRQR